jgi:glycosyltransferase involved in cell wall biosynthesis
MPPLRIGYYLCFPTALGGIEKQVLTLIDYLREKHSATVFCDSGQPGGFFRAELNARGVEAQIIDLPVKDEIRGVIRPLLNNLPAIVHARRILAASRLDVIHFHAGRLGFAYAPIVASRMVGIRTRILTLHNVVMRRSRPQRFIEERVLRALDQIIAVSAELKEELVSKKCVAEEKVRVIQNGIDFPQWDPAMEKNAARTALAIPAGSLVVGMVGRLDRIKGVDLLIRAVALVRAKVPNLMVVLIGAGPEEDALKRLAADQRVSDRVWFAGYRTDARRLMHAFDLVAMPSRADAQSFSLLEAMAGGKPVIGSNVGGIPSVLLDGTTGLLFPAEDYAALGEALVKLLNDPKKREEMGRAGRRRVESHFSQAAMLEQTVALYGNFERAPF